MSNIMKSLEFSFKDFGAFQFTFPNYKCIIPIISEMGYALTFFPALCFAGYGLRMPIVAE